MYRKIFFVLILSYVISSCNTNNPVVPPVESENVKTALPALFYKKMKGTLGDNEAITMDLTKTNDSTLDGRYYFDNTRLPLNIHGSIKSGAIKLKEYNERDELTGIFNGQFTANDRIEGTWENPKTKKSAAFKLTESKEGTTEITFENFHKENCKNAEKNRKKPAAEIMLWDTSCSYIDINLLKISSSNPEAATNINSSVVNSICKTGERKFNSINEYLNSVNDTANGLSFNVLEIGCGVVTNENNVLSIAISRYQNAGGAHPNFANDYINYDLSTGKQIMIDELFNPNYKTALDNTAEKIFKKNYGKTVDATWDFGKGGFHLNTNYAITTGGLLFLFNQYEIGPYAAGSPEVFIPYKEIEAIIKPGGVLSRFISKQNL